MSETITKDMMNSWDPTSLHVVEFVKQFGTDDDTHGFRYLKGTTGIVFEFNHWLGCGGIPEWHIMIGGTSLHIDLFVEYGYLSLTDLDPKQNISFTDTNRRVFRKVAGLIQGIKYHSDALNRAVEELRRLMKGNLGRFPDALMQAESEHWNIDNLVPWGLVNNPDSKT